MAVATVAQRLEAVQGRIRRAAERAGRAPQEVTLVAISKGFPVGVIREGAAAGLTDIGENRVQEATAKIPLLADLSVAWHLVGHLQTNKAKRALELFSVIHSVDSLHLAEALSRHAPATAGRSPQRVAPGDLWRQGPVPILLEVNVAEEESKFGFGLGEVAAAAAAIARLPNLEVRGLMTVAPLVPDPEEVRPVFRRLRELRDALGLRELSMGMTDDFEVAIEEGATMVRIGRAIFGERLYV